MEINSTLKFEGDIRWDEELRQWLEDYINKYPNHNTEVLSRSQYIGIPRGVLDSYLAGLYFRPKAAGGEGNNPKTSKVEPLIRAYQRKVGGTVHQGYGKPFFKTGAWRQMRSALKIALEENAIVVVYGKPGVGKSKSLNEFTLREMNTAPITVLCSRNITAGYFVKCVAEELKVRKSGTIAEVENFICKKLEKRPYALFVDQANFLSDRSLGSICHFWEKTKIPIALIGTYELYNNFITSTVTEDVRAQLTSRIAVHYPLPELNLEEVKTIIQHYLEDEATDRIITQIYSITRGIHRHLDMLINRIRDLKSKNFEMLDSGEIDMCELVNIAGSRLMIW